MNKFLTILMTTMLLAGCSNSESTTAVTSDSTVTVVASDSSKTDTTAKCVDSVIVTIGVKK